MASPEFKWDLMVKYGIEPLSNWIPGFWPIGCYSSQKDAAIAGYKLKSRIPGLVKEIKVINKKRTTG